MDYRHLVCFDFETTGSNPRSCEICQIGAVVINRNSLKIMDSFVSDCKVEDMDAVEDGALKVNHFTRERIAAAPDIKVVWPTFAAFVDKYNTKKDKSSFGLPIACGYNIDGFDMPITQRYCDKYGPWDKKRNEQRMFNPIFSFDVQKQMWFWMHNNPDLNSLKLTGLLEYMGIPKEEIENAHDALWDATKTAEVAIRLLNVARYLTARNSETGQRRLEMKGSFADG